MATPNDPVERLSVDLEIFGIPQSPDMPPMTETYLHVRRRQNGSASGVLGLPVYKGDPGETGPAGMLHKGDRTTAELDGLAMVLGPAELNYTYRNVDDDSQWVWTGDAFTVYADAYGTAGPPGPAPVLQGGTVTIGGVVQDSPAGVEVSGPAGGPYAIELELPEMPAGDPGPPGPAGPIYTSVDVVGEPDDGDTLVHDEALGKLVWAPPAMDAAELYVLPASMFPTVTKNSGDVRQILTSVTLPAKPYPYRLELAGGCDVTSAVGHQVNLEARVGDAVTGTLVGIGVGTDAFAGWRHVPLRSHSAAAIIPGSNQDVIAANTEATVYLSAVKVAGSTSSWGVRATNGQMRLKLVGVA
ncbi:hypothetical protein ACH47B_06475 [Rhodococcus sp. NPDC019627]|uniref:hypothetical protein n=1 Tax=unclassified Rhodococcus (in: high G+C Gram-positive bacteria) TaxID=192944 RepID=UPI003787B4D7